MLGLGLVNFWWSFGNRACFTIVFSFGRFGQGYHDCHQSYNTWKNSSFSTIIFIDFYQTWVLDQVIWSHFLSFYKFVYFKTKDVEDWLWLFGFELKFLRNFRRFATKLKHLGLFLKWKLRSALFLKFSVPRIKHTFEYATFA